MGITGIGKMDSAFVPGFPDGDKLDTFSEGAFVAWAIRLTFWTGMVSPLLWVIPVISSIYAWIIGVLYVALCLFRMLRVLRTEKAMKMAFLPSGLNYETYMVACFWIGLFQVFSLALAFPIFHYILLVALFIIGRRSDGYLEYNGGTAMTVPRDDRSRTFGLLALVHPTVLTFFYIFYFIVLGVPTLLAVVGFIVVIILLGLITFVLIVAVVAISAFLIFCFPCWFICLLVIILISVVAIR